MTRRLHTVAAILAFAAVYFCAGRFGLSLALVNPRASAIWPPTGLALAAMLLWGYRLWPGVLLGAFLVNSTTTGNPATDLGIAFGNTLEALLGAWLVNRFAGGAKAFERARDIFKFVLLAAMASTLVSASVGVTGVCLGREARWEQSAAIWSTWWIGDVMGDLMVAPLLLIWLRRPWPRLRPAQVAEAAGVLFAVILVSVFIFLGRAPSAQANQLKYLALLPLLWAAFRFHQHGAIAFASVVSGIALWSTLHGAGPFVTPDANTSLLFLQAFVATITLTALVVATVVSEGERFEQRLRLKDTVSRVLAESTRLKQAAPKIVQALCEAAGWDVGAMWHVDRTANELRCVEVWHIPSLELPVFEGITRQRTFAPGIGLPGRVWSSGQPAWILDVTKESNSPRAPFAQKDGLRGGVCFPIKLGDEVLGVLECFSRRVREPDPELLQMLANIGSQLGQFMERTLAEEALQQHNERMRLMHDMALDAIITIDAPGCVTDWNPQAEKIFGWTKTEALGKKLTETIIPLQYRDAHERGLRHYFKTGVGPVLEKRIEITALHRDGRELPIELAITPIVVEDQVCFSAFVRDITERKRLEERLRLVVEAAPNAMIMVGHGGRIAMVNAQAEKLFGYERTELLDKAIELLVPVRFRARHPEMVQEFFGSPQTRPIGAGRDLYGLAKDGREIPIEIGLNPIRTAEGQFVLASIIDITERKRAELILRDLNAELGRRVATRTAELEVEVTERRRAEALIRTALEEKKTLLEEIHHRVKNNLQVICSLLDLQGAYAKNQEDVTMFQECQNRVRTMAMVHERLYRSQNLASIDFGEHVRDLVNMLTTTYRLAEGQVQVFTEAESVQLQLETAIPTGLIVNELVSNALKHAFPDGRRGTLKVSLRSPVPGQLLLSVEDDGVGLSRTAQWDQGRSLGLRMVRDLARQIRGTLEVRQDGGSTFALSFPIVKSQNKPPLQP